MDLEQIQPILESIIRYELTLNQFKAGRYGPITNRVNTGKLRSSISSYIGLDSDGVQYIQVTSFGQPLNKYGPGLYFRNVNDGRRPGKKQPPPEVLEKWVKERITTIKEVNGVKPTVKQLAFLIGRSISKYGIKPTNIIDLSFDVLEDISKNKQIIEILEGQTIEDLFTAIKF